MTGKLIGIARKGASRAPMEEIESVRITTAAGVEGDHRGGSKERQVTVLSADVWRQVCREMQAELPWTMRRANFLVAGVELPREIGATLAIGGLELEVTEETAPCNRMEEQQPGLREALTADWRGGVCCRVLNDAAVALDDAVVIGATGDSAGRSASA